MILNDSDYASLANAVSAAGSNQTVIFISQAHTLNAHLTIPENVQLYFVGGSISVSATYTLTINGYIDGKTYQWFSGAGSVDMSACPMRSVYADWFGADQAGIEAAMDILTNNSGNIILQNGKVYDLTDTLEIKNGIFIRAAEPNSRIKPILRIDGDTWAGGNVGIETEEFSNGFSAASQYSGLIGIHLRVQDMNNSNFEWLRVHAIEQSVFYDLSFFLINSTIKTCFEFKGGPYEVRNVNCIYKSGTVSITDYFGKINCVAGVEFANLNFLNQNPTKGLLIKPGYFTFIHNMNLEDGPASSNGHIEIDLSGPSPNLHLANSVIQCDSSNSTAIKFINNSSDANIRLQNVLLKQHDSGGITFANAFDFFGTAVTFASLTTNSSLKIKELTNTSFQLGDALAEHNAGPIAFSYTIGALANSATADIPLPPTIKMNATFSSWFFQFNVSARVSSGSTLEKGYMSVHSISTQSSHTSANDHKTELHGAGNYTLSYDAGNKKFTITNDSGEGVSDLIISGLCHGPTIFASGPA